MNVYKPIYSLEPIIPYPKKWNEFELQAGLYSKLRLDGFTVRGEVQSYKVPNRSKTAKRRWKKPRFDLVVYSGPQKKAVAIIETKTSKGSGSETIQVTNYRLFNVPVIVFHDPTDYDELVIVLKKLIKENPPSEDKSQEVSFMTKKGRVSFEKH